MSTEVRNEVAHGLRRDQERDLRNTAGGWQFVGVGQVIRARHRPFTLCEKNKTKKPYVKQWTNLGKVREKGLVLFPFQHLARKPKTHTHTS